MSDFGPKWVRLAPNGTNPGLVKIRFGHAKTGFLPFGANLTHFGSISDIFAQISRSDRSFN